MHAHEHVLLAAHIALDDREIAASVQAVLVRNETKMPVFAWKINVRHLMHEVLRTRAVLNQRLNRDNVEPVFFCKLLELRRAHHMPVVRHDLAAESRGVKPREPREVCRRLRVARAAQHAALDGAQREDVSRAAELRGLCRRIDEQAHRAAALERGDARRRVVRIDGDGKRRLVIVRVVLHHLTNLQLVEPAADDRRADEPLRVRRHEIHVLGRQLLGGDDDVALVLAILIVHDDEHFPVLNVLDCLFNRCKIHVYLS